jgi:thioredoxin reductase
MGSVYETDVAIIGAGPVGLFAVFQCGMLRLKSVGVKGSGVKGSESILSRGLRGQSQFLVHISLTAARK